MDSLVVQTLDADADDERLARFIAKLMAFTHSFISCTLLAAK